MESNFDNEDRFGRIRNSVFLTDQRVQKKPKQFSNSYYKTKENYIFRYLEVMGIDISGKSKKIVSSAK